MAVDNSTTDIDTMITVWPTNYVSDAAVSYQDLLNLQEVRYTTQKIMSYSNGNNQSRVHIKKYMSTAKMFGVTKQFVKQDASFSAAASSVSPKPWI